jgi:hypothetical protein
MKSISVRLLIVGFLLTFLFIVPNLSQQAKQQKRANGWGRQTKYGRLYNIKSVESIIGRVIGVERIVPMKGMPNGVHLMVETSKETISVHLGPSWFIDEQKVKIALQDQVQIKGSRIMFNGKPVIIAEEVKKGEEELKLRDGNGSPAWSGQGRR